MKGLRSLGNPELVTALVGAVVGLGAGVFVLFGPVYATVGGGTSSDGVTVETSRTASLVSVGLQPLTAVVLGVAMLASMGIGMGGLLHARRGAQVGRAMLAISTVVLLAIAVLGALSIGPFLLPSVLLGFVALAAGSPPT